KQESRGQNLRHERKVTRSTPVGQMTAPETAGLQGAVIHVPTLLPSIAAIVVKTDSDRDFAKSILAKMRVSAW
ncbi:MAG: hypothetical protein RJP95_02655, partial [Pirellulales bacterium]